MQYMYLYEYLEEDLERRRAGSDGALGEHPRLQLERRLVGRLREDLREDHREDNEARRHNSLRHKADFTPLQDLQAGIYTCTMQSYNNLTFDILYLTITIVYM